LTAVVATATLEAVPGTFPGMQAADSIGSLSLGIPPVAIGSQPAPSDPDDAVDAEWRKLEAERIAEERDEAREDALEAAPAAKRWPWWAFAAALAAGVILAMLINSPSMRAPPPPADDPGVHLPSGSQGGPPVRPEQ